MRTCAPALSATMTAVSNLADDGDSDVRFDFSGSIAVAIVVGGLLALTARAGALELLAGVGAVQALLAFGVVFGLAVPGWLGALVIGGAASAAADVAVSVWPHSRLGTLLAVLGLAVPVMFVHQLWRGAARVRLLDSLGLIALLVLAEVALPALLQVRHEFGSVAGPDVASAVVIVGAAALIAGYLVDSAVAAPRLDADVPRGLLAVLGSALVGAAAGQLTLRDVTEFADGRGLLVGASLGALIALLAIAVAYVETVAPPTDSGFARRVRPAIGVLVSLSFLAPVAFLLCSAVRA